MSITRTGSRGMLRAEPLLMVSAAGLGPPGAEGVCRPAISGRRAAHPEGLGPVEKIGYLARQTQFTFRRCCIIPVGLVARQALALATFS